MLWMIGVFEFVGLVVIRGFGSIYWIFRVNIGLIIDGGSGFIDVVLRLIVILE